ncbi:MAG: PAS domain-containing sensor histidine kinase [Candidatus Latescibacterota bacterium]
MEKTHCAIEMPADLRKQAEDMVQDIPNLENASPAEIRGIIHEYEVNCAELKIQNRALRKACEEFEKTGETLARSERMYRKMVESARSVILRWKPDGSLAYINEFGVEFLGYSREELMEKGVGIFIPERESTGRDLSRLMTDIAANPEKYRYFENENILKSGERVSITWTNRPVYDSEGKLIEIISVGNDITERRRIENTLRESEEDLNRAQEVAQTGSWRLDTRSNALRWSDEAYRIFGIPEGTPLTYEIFLGSVHPEDREYVDRKWKAAWQGEPYDIEHRIMVGDTVKWVREKAELEFDDEGLLSGGFGTVQDITERKRAEESLGRSEAILKQAGQMASLGAWEIIFSNYEDINKNPLNWTDEVYHIFGYKPGSVEVTNDLFFERVHPDDRGRVRRAFARALVKKEPYSIEHRIIRPDGTERIVLEHSEIMLDDQGRPLRMTGAVQDITERKRAEERMVQLNERLVRSTAQLAALNKELEMFSYQVSHDLRAPLRSIDGFSLALLEDYSDRIDAEGQNFLTRIRAAVKRMTQLIEDLLSLSQTVRAESTYSTVNLSALAQSIIEELRQAEPARKVDVLIQENMSAEGDESLLRQVLENLLGNAWKFTFHTKFGRIEFGQKQEDGRREFFVRDNGAGFDMKRAENLFMPFRRLHTDRQFPGTGLGLSIVKRIVERYGGTIRAESEPGKGATFYFTLG